MKSVPIYFSLFLCMFIVLSDCQNTTFDIYAGVLVPNSVPRIDNEAQKTYFTTIRLEKTSPDNIFVSGTFTTAAGRFYSSALSGFVSVDNAQSREVSGLIIEVTYEVRYSFPVLSSSVGGNDTLIKNAIGNLASVVTGLNQQGDILAYYPAQEDEDSFSFTGSSMCSEAACPRTYISCIETTDGINVTCVSACKDGFCNNDGICNHTTANEIPTCICPTLADLWVIGARCETKFPLWLAVLLAVIGFLIILLVIVIVVLCVRRKRRREKRRLELLNTPTTGYRNNGFANDEIRAPVQPAPVARSNPVASLTREDSFETVTSGGTEPSAYRPRQNGNRHTSLNSSNHRERHHDHRHHHHHHHRRRHSSDEDRRRDHHRRRESDRSDRRSPPEQQTRQTSSESEDNIKEDLKNLSYYEVEVNDLDLETDAASSIAVSSTKSSPIRWLPPKDATARPGWVPSLGPMMYEIPAAKKTNDETLNRTVETSAVV